jgi:hypothetical protein
MGRAGRLEEGGLIVVWGGNRLIDCVALLSWKDRTVLRISTSPIRVDFFVPPGVSAGSQPLEIAANQLLAPEFSPRELSISSSPNAVAVLWTELPIVTAQDIGTDRVSGHPMVLLHTDLRPLGMNVFDDAAGIHVGEGLLARTAFSHCSTAIFLR